MTQRQIQLVHIILNEEAHKTWRKKWVESGYTWHSNCHPYLVPENWDPKKQLEGLEDK